MPYSAEDHWRSHTAAVQERILGKVMFALRLAGMGLPQTIRIELVKQHLRELENEGREAPTGDGA